MSIKHSAAILAVVALQAGAQPLTAPENVVNLEAGASREVTQDELGVVFTTTREGPEAAAVQSQLKQALDAALAEARRVAKPGQLEVRTGNFSLAPRYTPKGSANGWSGLAELIVEGSDAQAIAELTGRIQTMTIARVGYSLSRAARERVEADVTAQAIESFRAKAARMAGLFGFTGYLLREVHVGSHAPQPYAPAEFARSRVAAAPMADSSLPVEAGRATVAATVNGSIQLTR